MALLTVAGCVSDPEIEYCSFLLVVVFVSLPFKIVEVLPTMVLIPAVLSSTFVVSEHHVVYTVIASLTVVVALEMRAGEAVSEQIPDSQEVTVTSVVCSVDFELEIGHHVVYSVATPLTVVLEVETMAGETVLEQTLDSQEVMVTKVVRSLFSVVTYEGVEVILSSVCG